MLEEKKVPLRAERTKTPEVDPYDQSLWSPEKRERVAKARAEWESLIRRQEKDASPLERFAAKSVSSVLTKGNPKSKHYNPEVFESRAIRKRIFTDEDVIWLVFPGLNNANSGQDSFFLEGSASAPGSMDALPRQGTSYVFHGSTAIAGYTPEQLMRAMDQLLEDARLIIQKNPGKKICMYGFSGGTAPATYIANQIGLEQGRAIDKLILAAGGDSMAYGLFRTYATKEVAESYLDRGITVEEFHKAILPYTQMHNIKALPAGRNLLVHAGSDDHVVEMEMPHGTSEFVRRLQRAGKDPVYTIHQNRNHASLVLSLMGQERLGLDPFGLRTPLSIWENSESFENPELLGKLTSIFSNYSENELRDVGDYLRSRAGDGVRQRDIATLFDAPERAVIHELIRRNVLSFIRKNADAPAVLTLTERAKNPRGYLSRMKNRFKAVENLSKVVAVITMPIAAASVTEATAIEQTVDIVSEIKKLGFANEMYCVVIDGAMSVRADEHLTIVARGDLYETLQKSDWTYENGEFFAKGKYRVYRDFNGENFASLEKDSGMVDGIPVVNRTTRAQEEAGQKFTFEKAA